MIGQGGLWGTIYATVPKIFGKTHGPHVMSVLLPSSFLASVSNVLVAEYLTPKIHVPGVLRIGGCCLIFAVILGLFLREKRYWKK